MRLADRIIQSVDSKHDIAGSISNLAAALQSAERFEFDDRFTKACEELATSKPSSLLAALPLCRLPYGKVWLEWRVAALELAVTGDKIPPSKMGCLLESNGLDLQTVSATWAWYHDDDPDTDGVSLCPIGAVMSWDPERTIPDIFHALVCKLKSQSTPELAAAVQAATKAAERAITTYDPATLMRQSNFGRFVNCPSEVDAFRKIASHSMTAVSQHTEELFTFLTDGQSANTRAKLISMWQSDIGGEAAFIQCAIALLNARNCVANSRVDLTKLNKSRTKKRKPPLLSYSITRLDLSKTQRRLAAAAGIETSVARQHLVRGHIKVRKTGIYWWCPFARGVGARLSRKAYTVKASLIITEDPN